MTFDALLERRGIRRAECQRVRAAQRRAARCVATGPSRAASEAASSPAEWSCPAGGGC